MLYTLTDPKRQPDRVELYPNVDAAIAHAGDGGVVYRVAVDFDATCRLLLPRWLVPEAFDPAWTTPAELHGDGSVTAKGLIPTELFVAFGCARR